ncbi:MAG: PQQ-dependent sugar dehydrogenase [Xanthobacteraceae bacterium]|nr:MAG: PQQ-dependent sugar dehydrogenase [Xanthobacteraceae bacterium]
MRAPHALSGLVALAAMLAATVLPAAGEDGSIVSSSAGDLRLETIAGGLAHPWGLTFLTDGQMLVTERPGRIRLVSAKGEVSAPLSGVPQVWAVGQGGLLDIAADRDFARNGTIYFCYAEPVAGGGRTAVARARLIDAPQPHLDATTVIFRQDGPLSSANHHGCRIAQAPDRNLFIALGEHFTHRDEAQNLGNHLGKIVRIAPDGAVPKDNPFAGRAGARGEIWSYGHRNPQSLAINPASGQLWEIEHGPRGGDEVNIIAPGRNYGWPVIGYGIDYNGAKIHASTHKEGMEQPIKYWVPSIAPSGMAFLRQDRFRGWRGSLFTGALAGRMLVRLSLDGDKVSGEERLLQSLNERIRDVREGPDGALWLLTDNAPGRILRLSPAGR